MGALYIASSGKGSGKTALCAGLGKYLQSEGKKAGYLKPGGEGDGDAAFVKSLLGIGDSVDTLTPPDDPAKAKTALAAQSEGKDVVIIEGASGTKAAAEMAKALGAKVIIIESWPGRKKPDLSAFGDALLGVVLNKVPKSRIDEAKSSYSGKAPLLGVIPEDRTLLAISVGELAEAVKGEVLGGGNKSGDLVENVMLGALVVDSGLDYFDRKESKAVVLKSERSDLQMAAIKSGIRCMVISGDTPIHPMVLTQVKEKNVPVILTKDAVASVADTIEKALVNVRFSQADKLPRMTELLSGNIDMAAVSKGIGLAG